MTQNLDQTLQTIRATMYLHKNNAYFPYFFIVGAGVSVPEIPSASKIIDICKKTVQEIDYSLFSQYEEESKSFAENGMKYYSSWIEYAYPNRINRSQLFRDLCSKAKISSANLMLAQILNSRQFANTVFTTNFDDSIKKALDLMGVKNYFCAENIMDNLVISNQTKDIQVVHVHGTFNFYDCANLEKEIDNIASQSGTVSSAQLLSSFLSNQAPIIVGYSGWENDVIMRCLKERLTYPTPLQYIWICYDKKSYYCLPEWIKKSDSVIFVIPESNHGNCDDSCDTNPWGDADASGTLDATMFFKRIISDHKLSPPTIFTNPYQYYSQSIKSLLPENEDVLHLRHWTQRLKILESDDVFEQLVQSLESVYISKDYVRASDIILEMSSLQLSEANAEFVCTSLIRDFIRDEAAISSFEQRFNFHIASLQFVNNNLHQLSNTKSLVSTMRTIIFTRCRYSEKENLLILFDKAIELAKRNSSLLIIELTALAMKSDFVNRDHKKTILMDVISRCPDVSNNKDFARLKFKALCELSSTVSSSEAVHLIKEAEAIPHFSGDNLHNVYISLKKSELLPKVDDSQTKDRWIKDIFDVIKNPSEVIDQEDYIEIVSNLSFVQSDFIERYSEEYDIENTIISLLKHCEINLSKCHTILHYSQCCELICRISNNPTVVEQYCNKIFEVRSSFPHKCNAFLSTLKIAMINYMSLPSDIAIESTIVNILQEIREDEKTNCIYFDLLEYSYDIGLISEHSVFNSDIEYLQEQRNKSKYGYNLYSDGKHKEAENIFVELLDCKISGIVDMALTNLGFMVRRNEASSNLDFEIILQKKTVLTGFDYINIILFYRSKGLFENELYQKAISSLKKLSDNEKTDIISWWSKIDIVGVEESEQVMSLIKSK